MTAAQGGLYCGSVRHKKYHTLISDKLSPVQAIQFIQVENRVNMVIDIMIASEMPLFKHP